MIEVVCSEARLPKPNAGFGGVGKQLCRDWVGSLWHIYECLGWGSDRGKFSDFFLSRLRRGVGSRVLFLKFWGATLLPVELSFGGGVWSSIWRNQPGGWELWCLCT